MSKSDEEGRRRIIGIPRIRVSFIASLRCSPCKTGAVVHYAAPHIIII